MIEMAEEKQALQEFVGIYVGKEARRKRVFKSGANAGKEVIQYGLRIKEREDSQFPKSFTIDGTCKGFDTIKELDWIKLGYVVDSYVNKQGQPTTSHKVLWIGKHNPASNGGDMAKAVQKVTEAITKPDLSHFEAFKAKYLVALEKAGIKPNMVHMLGSWIASNEKERVSELLKKCEEALKPLSETPPPI